MEFTFVAGLLLGMLGALMLNIGKGVQKQKVQVLKQGRRMFRAPHRRDLGVWLIGLALTATAAVPISLGLKLSESPSIVSAMTGIGLVGLTIYATRVIGERVGWFDGSGIALVVVGTSALSFLAGGEKPPPDIDTTLLTWTVVAMVGAAVALCLLALVIRPIHGVVYGAAAGLGIGLAIFLDDVALVRAGGDFAAHLQTPGPYFAYLFAIAAMVVTQLGFFRARALVVVPAINSSIILSPMLLERIVYGRGLDALGLVMVGVIVVGVVILSTGAAARVSK